MWTGVLEAHNIGPGWATGPHTSLGRRVTYLLGGLTDYFFQCPLSIVRERRGLGQRYDLSKATEN